MATFSAEVEAPQYRLHEEDEWLDASIVDVELQPSTKAGFDDQYKWTLHIDGDLNDDGSQRETWHWTGTKLTTKQSKFRTLVKGVTGREPELGEKVAFDLPVSVKVMFTHSKKDDGSIRESIDKIKRA